MGTLKLFNQHEEAYQLLLRIREGKEDEYFDMLELLVEQGWGATMKEENYKKSKEMFDEFQAWREQRRKQYRENNP